MNAPTAARGRNDAQKSWHDRSALRRAELYVAGVIAVMFAALGTVILVIEQTGEDCGARLCGDTERYLIASPAAVLILGVLGAFVQTIRVWRRGGAWPIWQGAGWVLMVFAVVYMILASGAVAGPA